MKYTVDTGQVFGGMLFCTVHCSTLSIIQQTDQALILDQSQGRPTF